MNSQKKISYENNAPKKHGHLIRESHNGPQKSMNIPWGNLIQKTCAAQKHQVPEGLGQKRRPSSFTGNAQEKMAKEPWATYCGRQKKATLSFMHDQLLSPLLNLFPSNTPNPLSPELTLACIPLHRLLATNPRLSCLGTRAKMHEIS
jgi:hypothetical protein